MKQKRTTKAWAITDWGGGIKHPSVSIFDTKKDAKKELDKLNKLPEPIVKGERNQVVPCTITYTLPKKVKNKAGK